MKEAGSSRVARKSRDESTQVRSHFRWPESPRVPHPGERAPAHGVRARRRRRRSRPRLPGRPGRRRGRRSRSRALHPAHLRFQDRHRARAGASLRRRSRGEAVAWSVVGVEPDEIDRLNIHQASLRAMQRAVLALAPLPDMVLVDAFRIPDLPMAQRGIVHGDAPLHRHRGRVDRGQSDARSADAGAARRAIRATASTVTRATRPAITWTPWPDTAIPRCIAARSGRHRCLIRSTPA